MYVLIRVTILEGMFDVIVGKSIKGQKVATREKVELYTFRVSLSNVFLLIRVMVDPRLGHQT